MLKPQARLDLQRCPSLLTCRRSAYFLSHRGPSSINELLTITLHSIGILECSQGYHSLYTGGTTVSNRLRGKRALGWASQAPIRFWNNERTPMVYPCQSHPSKVVHLNHFKSPASLVQTSTAESVKSFVHPSSLVTFSRLTSRTCMSPTTLICSICQKPIYCWWNKSKV